jgi:hypothetical protein
VSRLDHPSYSSSRRDDAATPRAGESTTGRAPAERTAAEAGAHHRPGGYGWAIVGLVLVAIGVVSCQTDADGSPFCAEVACIEHDG